MNDPITRRKQSFLLRLPLSLREQATKIAQEEGTSLNHFIALALAEKISRMEHQHEQARKPLHAMPQRPAINYPHPGQFPQVGRS
jgi:hypothetical protein